MSAMTAIRITPHIGSRSAMVSSWGAAQLSFRLHQLDPITKGIIDIKPIIPLQGRVSRYMVSRVLQARRQFPQTLHDEGGMGLPSRQKILLHAQMNFNGPRSNQHPPRTARCGGFATSGIPSTSW
jgi:hypothetical protein